MAERVLKEDEAALLQLAVAAARRAGELLLKRFAAAPTGVEAKTSPTDPVSDADRDAEEALLQVISSARPQDGILAEEGGREASRSGLTWIVDPLDGTVNFLYGIPVWSVSVAAHDAGGPFLGVVHDPNRGETFTAVRGLGARLNDRPIAVSDRPELATALIATGFGYDPKARAAQSQRMPRLLPRVRDLRRAGSAALDLCYVACGRYDGYFESPMNLWDRAAGELIVTEAGGATAPLIDPIGESHGLIASNRVLHDALKKIVLADEEEQLPWT